MTQTLTAEELVEVADIMMTNDAWQIALGAGVALALLLIAMAWL